MNGQVWVEPDPATLPPRLTEQRHTAFIPYVLDRIVEKVPQLAQACSDSYRPYVESGEEGLETLLGCFPRGPFWDSDRKRLSEFLTGMAFIFGLADESEFDDFLQSTTVNLDFGSQFCQMTLLHHAVIQDKPELLRKLLIHREKCPPEKILLRDKCCFKQINEKKLINAMFTTEEYPIGAASCLWLALALTKFNMAEMILRLSGLHHSPRLNNSILLETYPRSDPMSSLACLPASVREAELTRWAEEDVLHLDPHDKHIPLSNWHFAIPYGMVVFQLLSKYLPLPYHIAVQLHCYCDVSVSEMILGQLRQKLCSASEAADATFPVEGQVTWSQASLHHETFGIMGLNETNYEKDWNYRHERFDVKSILTFLSVMPTNAEEGQVQMIFVQCALVAICTSKNFASPFSRREQLFLLAGFLAVGAQLEGWPPWVLKMYKRILPFEVYRSDPYYGLGHTFLHSVVDWECEAYKVFIFPGSSNNVMHFLPFVLRLCAQPYPQRTGPETANRIRTTHMPVEERQIEDDIIELLYLPMANRVIRDGNLDLIPIDMQKNRLHNGSVCAHYKEPGHGYVFKRQMYMNTEKFVCPFGNPEYRLPSRLTNSISDTEEYLEDNAVRQMSQIGELLKILLTKPHVLLDEAELDALWPNCLHYLDQERLARGRAVTKRKINQLLMKWERGDTHVYDDDTENPADISRPLHRREYTVADEASDWEETPTEILESDDEENEPEPVHIDWIAVWAEDNEVRAMGANLANEAENEAVAPAMAHGEQHEEAMVVEEDDQPNNEGGAAAADVAGVEVVHINNLVLQAGEHPVGILRAPLDLEEMEAAFQEWLRDNQDIEHMFDDAAQAG